MRKPIFIIVALTFTLAMSACDASSKDRYDHIDFAADTYTIEEDISLTHHRIGSHLEDEAGMEESIRLFETHEAFSAFKNELFEDAEEGFEDGAFATHLKGITSDYFDEKTLILLYLVEGSGSNAHRVRDISLEDDTVIVDVLRRTPEIGTADMAYWTILIEGDKESLAGEKVEMDIESYTP